MAATDETRELVRRALERENPFAGSTFDGPRLIWHPEVHRLFGERCVFFILQIQDPQLGPTEEEVGLLVSKAGAAARAVYPLYGYYDVLVRAWVTPAIRDRLVGEFHEAV